MPSVRREFVIDAARDAKLQRIAVARQCSEGSVIEEAIDQLPEAAAGWMVALLRVGLLATPQARAEPKEELDQLAAAWEAVAARIGDIGLSAAVIAERED